MWETMRQAERATVQLLRAAVLALASLFYLPLLLFTAVATATVVGAAVLPEAALVLRRAAAAKRRQVAEWTGEPVPEAYPPLAGEVRERIRTVLRDPGTLHDLRWLGLYCGYGWLPACATAPVWCLGLVVDGFWCGLLGRRAVLLPLVERLADLDAAWSGALLQPAPESVHTAELARRVEELTETRAGAVAAHGAELRRIERDLHDGAQAQLVALSMRIGLAKLTYDRDPQVARGLLDDAQDQAEQALTELRQVVRGIHPPILTDRGLVGAVRALAASSGLQVSVRADGVEDGPRAPAAVEAAAYFVVAEALTNAAKHSGAAEVEVLLACDGGRMRISVRDNGRGGALEADTSSVPGQVGGSGLSGMRRRVAALDGTMKLSSPVGGPTVIDVELPCAW